MNKADIEKHGLKEGDEIDLLGAAGDSVPRTVCGLRVVTYDLPQGSCAGYYPECNPLLPLWHHAEGSHVRRQSPDPVLMIEGSDGHRLPVETLECLQQAALVLSANGPNGDGSAILQDFAGGVVARIHSVQSMM